MTDCPHLAARMGQIEPFYVMELLARARALEAAGRDIVHMEIGEPDFPTPEPITEAGLEALRAQHTQYTPATGLAALREAIAGHYRARYGVDVAPQRILITPGASGALALLMGVLVDPGDAVLMADPGYPCNRHFVRLFEGRPLSVPVDAATGYQLTSALLERHWHAGVIGALVATPSNPTGTLVPHDDLRAMVAFTRSREGVLIVDEIYHGLVYGESAQTAVGLGDNVFVINSFSKYFGMTGWRLGWVVAPEPYVRELDKLAQNIFLAASTPAQHAALAAFGQDCEQILVGRRETLRRRRDFLLPALRNLGFEIPLTPQGAFYLYANCEGHSRDSFEFAARLLDEAGVAVTPGRDFGRHRARSHLRFAYTTSMARLECGVARLAGLLS
jgi:aspartate/methionine/tyrosine aminotransferase